MKTLVNMKLINPSVERWQCGYTLPEIWSHIARCARVCYQSTPRNNGETDEEFVKRVILRNYSLKEIGNNRELQLKLHLSVLEHGTVYLEIDTPAHYVDFDTLIEKYLINKYSKVNLKPKVNYITTNMRVLVENGWTKDLQFICAPTEYHYLRTTLNFITDIGVARELDRHRSHSISEESTRFVNYSKDKFGGELTFIIPTWVNTKCPNKENEGPSSADLEWSTAMLKVEASYMNLLKIGWNPQQARQVLPLNTKVQTVHTAFNEDWDEFIKLRAKACSGTVHPNMQYIALDIEKNVYGNN